MSYALKLLVKNTRERMGLGNSDTRTWTCEWCGNVERSADASAAHYAVCEERAKSKVTPETKLRALAKNNLFTNFPLAVQVIEEAADALAKAGEFEQLTIGALAAWKRDYEGEKRRGDLWMADCKAAEKKVEEMEAFKRVTLSMHEALRVQWGVNVYKRIEELLESENSLHTLRSEIMNGPRDRG